MNDAELLRYNRQLMLPEIDIDGQEKLLNSTVLIIGMVLLRSIWRPQALVT
jgi:molybdopterin-synthase adenylyltransferase